MVKWSTTLQKHEYPHFSHMWEHWFDLIMLLLHHSCLSLTTHLLFPFHVPHHLTHLQSDVAFEASLASLGGLYCTLQLHIVLRGMSCWEAQTWHTIWLVLCRKTGFIWSYSLMKSCTALKRQHAMHCLKFTDYISGPVKLRSCRNIVYIDTNVINIYCKGCLESGGLFS